MTTTIELKQLADKIIEIVCLSRAKKIKMNNQFMYLAMSVNTKKEFMDTVINYYNSNKMYKIVLKLKKIEI